MYYLHFCLSVLLPSNRPLVPFIHKLFNNKPLTELKCFTMRSYIVEDGLVKWMSPAIEDFFASGCNYSHDQGAVHATPLQALFKTEQWWHDYDEGRKAKKPVPAV